jgi:hypothetical protein
MAPRLPLRRIVGISGCAVAAFALFVFFEAIYYTDDPMSRNTNQKNAASSQHARDEHANNSPPPAAANTRRGWPPIAEKSSYDESSTVTVCVEWSCSCQGLSDLYGTWPGHWGRAVSIEAAKSFWMAQRCRTCPAQDEDGSRAACGGGGGSDAGGDGGISTHMPDVATGDIVSAVLKGTAPWPSAEKPGDLAFGGRLRFRPGVLSLNSTESFRHCYVDPHSYGGHFLHSHGRIGVSISEENKLIYILVSCACARLCSHVASVRRFTQTSTICTRTRTRTLDAFSFRRLPDHRCIFSELMCPLPFVHYACSWPSRARRQQR